MKFELQLRPGAERTETVIDESFPQFQAFTRLRRGLPAVCPVG